MKHLIYAFFALAIVPSTSFASDNERLFSLFKERFCEKNELCKESKTGPEYIQKANEQVRKCMSRILVGAHPDNGEEWAQSQSDAWHKCGGEKVKQTQSELKAFFAGTAIAEKISCAAKKAIQATTTN